MWVTAAVKTHGGAAMFDAGAVNVGDGALESKRVNLTWSHFKWEQNNTVFLWMIISDMLILTAFAKNLEIRSPLWGPDEVVSSVSCLELFTLFFFLITCKAPWAAQICMKSTQQINFDWLVDFPFPFFHLLGNVGVSISLIQDFYLTFWVLNLNPNSEVPDVIVCVFKSDTACYYHFLST